MTANIHRLVLIPGLGADARLFERQRREFPQLEVPGWIEPRPREPLREYAARLAATIDRSSPLVLGGVSIGGMLALEMARHLPTSRVVLIASCRGPVVVSPLLRVGERLARPFPSWLISRGAFLAPFLVGRGGGIGADDRRLLARMAREIPMEFIRWGGRAILEWPGCPDPGAPVAHVHGDRDWVLPLKGVAPTRVVRGGCHVLNLSHPDEVNRFIRENLAPS